MFFYYLYGCVTASDIEFPQLVKMEHSNVSPDITICSGSMPEELMQKTECGIQYEFGENFSWLQNRTCIFYVEQGKKIVYHVKPEGLEMRLKNYLLGFGMAMLFLQRGEMAIHCSALHNGTEAILIAGESGSGKSTLTNSYLATGWKLMADDMVIAKYDKTGKTLVYPAFPFQKLCRNVAIERGYDLNELIYINEQKDKFLVPYREKFEVTPKPLKAFIMLGVHRGDDFFAQEIKSIDKLKICVNNLFLRHLLGNQKYAPHIGQKCLELIAGVEVYLIGRPEGKDTTELTRKTVFQFIS